MTIDIEHHSNPEDSPPRRSLRRLPGGCLYRVLLVVLIPLFLCGGLITIYLVFPPAPLNIVVMGLDSREGEGMATRTDSIILAGIDPAHFQVSLLSIPRDLFIDTPGYGMQRINTINVLGEMQQKGDGPRLLSQSIAQNFDLRMDRFVRLDFRGFVELIDAVGGVWIDVDRVLVDNAYPTPDGGTMSVRFESGVQLMDGERALIYARTRHSDDDYRRAMRQQQVVSALVARLKNPFTWPAVVDVLNRSMQTDMTLGDLLAVAPSVVLSGGRFNQLVIDRDYILPGDGYSIPNYTLLAPWIDAHFR